MYVLMKTNDPLILCETCKTTIWRRTKPWRY